MNWKRVVVRDVEDLSSLIEADSDAQNNTNAEKICLFYVVRMRPGEEVFAQVVSAVVKTGS